MKDLLIGLILMTVELLPLGLFFSHRGGGRGGRVPPG
jgi:hypothetical protein